MMCDKCIHNHVCCDEGKDEGLTFCADFMEERLQGEWIAREDMDYLVVHNHFECNKCGLIHDFLDGHTSQYNFCPNCGADMKGVSKNDDKTM